MVISRLYHNVLIKFGIIGYRIFVIGKFFYDSIGSPLFEMIIKFRTLSLNRAIASTFFTKGVYQDSYGGAIVFLFGMLELLERASTLLRGTKLKHARRR